MELNISDHLSEDELKGIAERAFQQVCLEKFRTDSERIFSNAAYKAVFNMVNEMHDGKVAELISAKTVEVIKTLDKHTVFDRASHWQKRDSAGYTAMETAIRENQDILTSRVSEVFAAVSQEDLRSMIQDSVAEILDEHVFKRAAA